MIKTKYFFENGKGQISFKGLLPIFNDGKSETVFSVAHKAFLPYGELLDGRPYSHPIILSRELTKTEQAEVLSIMKGFDTEQMRIDLIAENEEQEIITARTNEYKNEVDGLTLEAVRVGVTTVKGKALLAEANEKVEAIKTKHPKKK